MFLTDVPVFFSLRPKTQGRRENHGLAVSEKLIDEFTPGRFLDVLDYVTHQPNIKLAQCIQNLGGVADVNFVVSCIPDGISIALEDLDSFDVDLPFLAAKATLPCFQIFARNHSPFSETDTDLENGSRLQPLELRRDKGKIAGVAYPQVFLLSTR